jgi:hypothetical protein
MNRFENGKIKDSDELQKKIESRVTFLAARNPSRNMRECILEGFADDKKENIIKRADELRATWMARKTGEEENVNKK